MVSGSENSQSSHSASELSGLNKDQQFLGDASAAIPNFGHIELGSEDLPEDVSLECLSAYESLYLQNCEVQVLLLWFMCWGKFLQMFHITYIYV